MSRQELEITEVLVVVSESYCDKLKDAVDKLATAGVEIFSTDVDECVVSGSIETYKLSSLEKLDCVNYVRSVQTYIAEFPAGDPRAGDGAEDDEDSAEAV